jgi:hypothetical protein
LIQFSIFRIHGKWPEFLTGCKYRLPIGILPC